LLYSVGVDSTEIIFVWRQLIHAGADTASPQE
jgi:hypothetical protein